MNQQLNPEAYRKAYDATRPLAKLAAAVARHQLRLGLHFLVERPNTSLLWDLPEWKELLTMHSVLMNEIDQC